MRETEEDIRMRAIPVQLRLPCRGCKYLEPVFHTENGERRQSDYYMKCTFQPPIGPTAYWQYPQPYKEPEQWRNIKYMDGPFTEDAKIVECGVRDGD